MGGFGQLYPRGAPPFPPLDVPYLAAILTERALPVEVIEAVGLDLSIADVCARIGRVSTSGTLLLVRTSLPTLDWDLHFCAEVKGHCPDAAVALFGPVVSSVLRRVQQDPTIDYAILGEPDETVVEVMEGAPLEQIAGLLFRGAGGGWTQTVERPVARELDSLPFPRWDLLPHDRYVIPKSSTSGRLRFLPMLSSRGCPYGCGYCPYPVGQGLKWRFRSPVNVVDEMQHLVLNFGVQYILFRDPMFSMQQHRVVAICQEIIRRGLHVQWKCETRVDCLDASTIRVMARAGCTGINFGVESTDPEIQERVLRKPILMDEFVKKAAICHANGISTFAFFIVGLPGDTVETILSSIDFAVRIRAKWTQFTLATPFAGTPLHDWAVRQGLIEPGFYRIVSAHQGSLGNEHLRAGDIERLYRFARFLQDNLLNRRGLLKNATRRRAVYEIARRFADALAYAAGVLLVAAARRYYRLAIVPLPPAAPRDRHQLRPLVVLQRQRAGRHATAE
jgi:hypothetical protein